MEETRNREDDKKSFSPHKHRACLFFHAEPPWPTLLGKHTHEEAPGKKIWINWLTFKDFKIKILKLVSQV